MAILPRGGRRLDNSNGIFGNVSVPDPQRSGFDLSYRNRFNGHMAWLYPSFWRVVNPGDTMDLSCGVSVSAMPLINPIFDNVDVCFESFYVPHRLVDPLFNNFYTGVPQSCSISSVVPKTGMVIRTPDATDSTAYSVLTARGYLMDFFGFGNAIPSSVNISSPIIEDLTVSAYPLLSYWRIIFDWYQNKQTMDLENSSDYSLANSWSSSNDVTTTRTFGKWYNRLGQINPNLYRSLVPSSLNSLNICKPFVRLYDRDLLTTSLYNSASSTPAIIETSQGYFDMGAFRMSSALDRFAIRENLSGSRTSDIINGHFGVKPDYSSLNAEYLGSFRIPLQVNEVTQTSATDIQSGDVVNALGEHAGVISGNGIHNLFSGKTFTEVGIVMTLCSINVPASYYQFRRRDLLPYSTRTSLVFPELANIGDEPVTVSDFCSVPLYAADSTKIHSSSVVGFNERYWYCKSMRDEIHGNFADHTSELFNYHAGTEFDSSYSISSLSTFLPNYSPIQWSKLESKLFAYAPDDDFSHGPFLFNVSNICHVSSCLPEHGTPMI